MQSMLDRGRQSRQAAWQRARGNSPPEKQKDHRAVVREDIYRHGSQYMSKRQGLITLDFGKTIMVEHEIAVAMK